MQKPFSTEFKRFCENASACERFLKKLQGFSSVSERDAGLAVEPEDLPGIVFLKIEKRLNEKGDWNLSSSLNSYLTKTAKNTVIDVSRKKFKKKSLCKGVSDESDIRAEDVLDKFVHESVYETLGTRSKTLSFEDHLIERESELAESEKWQRRLKALPKALEELSDVNKATVQEFLKNGAKNPRHWTATARQRKSRAFKLLKEHLKAA